MIKALFLAASAMMALSGPSSAANPAYCDAIASVGETVMSLRQSGGSYDDAVSAMTVNFGADAATLKIALGIVDEAFKDAYPVRSDDAGRTLIIDGFRSTMRDMCMGG